MFYKLIIYSLMNRFGVYCQYIKLVSIFYTVFYDRFDCLRGMLFDVVHQYDVATLATQILMTLFASTLGSVVSPASPEEIFQSKYWYPLFWTSVTKVDIIPRTVFFAYCIRTSAWETDDIRTHSGNSVDTVRYLI